LPSTKRRKSGEGVGVLEAVLVAVAEEEGVPEAVALEVGVPELVHELEGVTEGSAPSLRVAVLVALGVMELEGVFDGVPEGVLEEVLVADAVAVLVTVAEAVGITMLGSYGGSTTERHLVLMILLTAMGAVRPVPVTLL